MKRISYILLSMAFAVAALAGCSKEEAEEAYLRIERSDVDFSAAGGTGEILISTNAASVSAVSGKDWLTITSENTESVLFSVAESGDEFSRVASVTITAGGVSQEVTVSQMGVIFDIGADGISDLSLAPEGETLTIPYSTNSGTPQVTLSDNSWLTAEVDSENIILTAGRNNSKEERTVSVTIAAGWKTLELTVSQDRIYYFLQESFSFSKDAVTGYEIEPTESLSSIGWTVSSDSDWITAEKTSGGNLSFTLASNESGATRSGKINVTDESGSALTSIEIRQGVWNYDYFLGQWTLYSNDELGPVRAVFQENVPGESYTMLIEDSMLGAFPLYVTYDSSTASLNLKAQYVSLLEGLIPGYYFWWCATYGEYVTWAEEAGMDMVYNMDDKNPELVCESDGEYGEDITGFSLYVFSSQQASSSNVVGYWSLFTSMTKLTR